MISFKQPNLKQHAWLTCNSFPKFQNIRNLERSISWQNENFVFFFKWQLVCCFDLKSSKRVYISTDQYAFASKVEIFFNILFASHIWITILYSCDMIAVNRSQIISYKESTCNEQGIQLHLSAFTDSAITKRKATITTSTHSESIADTKKLFLSHKKKFHSLSLLFIIDLIFCFVDKKPSGKC